MKTKPQKEIRVLDSPPTIILVDADMDENIARERWLKRYYGGIKPIDQIQRDKEWARVREGKVLQRRNKYKRLDRTINYQYINALVHIQPSF